MKKSLIALLFICAVHLLDIYIVIHFFPESLWDNHTELNPLMVWSENLGGVGYVYIVKGILCIISLFLITLAGGYYLGLLPPNLEGILEKRIWGRANNTKTRIKRLCWTFVGVHIAILAWFVNFILVYQYTMRH